MTGGHTFAECRGRSRRTRCRFCHAYHHPSLCHDAPPLPMPEQQEEAVAGRSEDPMKEQEQEEIAGQDQPKNKESEKEKMAVSDEESDESNSRNPQTFGIYDVNIELEDSDDDDPL